jgi:hypothetical protein
MKPTDNSKSRTWQILSVMKILAWVAFVGFLIEAGAILLSYTISTFSEESALDLCKGLNLFSLRQFNFWHYTLYVSLIVSLSIMKSYTALLVIKMLSKVNLANPFTMEVVSKLERISYVIFGTWLVTMITNGHISWLVKVTGELHGNWISGEFIFMAGVVYVFSQIFKRGVEIQSENELTV